MSYVKLIYRDAEGRQVAEQRVQAEHIDDEAHAIPWATSREVVPYADSATPPPPAALA